MLVITSNLPIETRKSTQRKTSETIFLYLVTALFLTPISLDNRFPIVKGGAGVRDGETSAEIAVVHLIGYVVVACVHVVTVVVVVVVIVAAIEEMIGFTGMLILLSFDLVMRWILLSLQM